MHRKNGTENPELNRLVGGRAHVHASRSGWWNPVAIAAAAMAMFGSAVIAYPSTTMPRILVNESVTPVVAAQFPKRNAVNSLILSTYALDPDQDGRLNEDALIQALNDTVPRVYQGPVCLDWEGTAYNALYMNPQSPACDAAIQEFVRGLLIAKRERPNAQFGYYALPTSPFEQDLSWELLQHKFQPIFDASDCLFPSVYDHYATGQAFTSVEYDLARVRGAVTMALKLANGKPVYPYISPRYHEGNPTYGMFLIPRDEFEQQVSEIFKVQVDGQQAAGVVWWGADRYYLWIARQNYPAWHPLYALSLRCRIAFAAEFQPGETDDQHFTRIHKVVLRNLAEALSTASQLR